MIGGLERKGAGELDFDLGGQFGDSGPDFQEPFLYGIELSADPFGVRRRHVAQAVQQYIGGAMEKQAELIGAESVTGGSVGGKACLMVLDKAFHPATSAIDALINEGRLRACKIGHHIAWVKTTFGDLGFEYDPPGVLPATRLIGKRGKQA